MRARFLSFALALATLFFGLPPCPAIAQHPERYGGMKLLDGYSIKRETALDVDAWTIEKDGGPSIHFEAGTSEGSLVNTKDRSQYAWTRTQVINNYKVVFAMVKPGLKTVWEQENGRGLPPGNILLVTFFLDRSHPDHTANFTAKVGDEEELADVLLMVMTFDPSKGIF